MSTKHYTKSSSSLTDKLIDIASSENDTSGDESDTHSRSIRMTNVQRTDNNLSQNYNYSPENCKKSHNNSNSYNYNSASTSPIHTDKEDCSQTTLLASLPASSSSHTAEIDIDQEVHSESKWSFSGGSVLGMLSSSTENDYSLWVRVKEKKRLKEANNSFFSSTIFSLFSSPNTDRYSFDEILVADDVKPNTSHHHKTNSRQQLIDKDSSLSDNKQDRKKSRRNNSSNIKDTGSMMNSSDGFGSKSEMQKLMLSNGALGVTTNINLNDDDDENEFLALKKENHVCDWGLYKGIFYALLSSLFFSLSCVIVKYLKNIHPGQLAVARYVGVLVLSIPLLIYHRQSPFAQPEMRHLLVLRGICGSTALFLRFYAFRYLPIADASVIVFSIPIFVSIFGHFFLNEPCGLFQTFIVILAMIGLMLSTKIPFLFGEPIHHSLLPLNGTISGNFTVVSEVEEVIKKFNPTTLDKDSHILGVTAGLASLLFASAVYVFIRKAKGVHYSVIMVWFGAVAIIETTVLTLLLHGFSMPQTTFEWRMIAFLAVFAFLGQILLTRALQLEHAGSVSVARSTSDISFGFLWQISIFNELPDGYSISGAILVSSCIFLITLKNWVNSLPEHSRIRSRLRFVTL